MKVPMRFLLRDLALASVMAGLWALAHDLGGQTGVGPTLLRVVAGVSIALAAALLHEWGHLAGALASGSRVHFPKRTLTPLLFDFDVANNSREQFLAMSAGGYLGSALGLAVLAWAQPPVDLTGYVAWLIAGGGVLATVLIEAPVTLRVARGAAPPAALLRVADEDD